MRKLMHIVLLGTLPCSAQHIAAGTDIPCSDDGSVKATLFHADSLCSTTLICIPRSVAPHYHRHRTEHITVIGGEGLMLLGKDTLRITPGDVVTIPKGTVHAAWATGHGPLRVVSVHAPPFDGRDRVPVEP